MPNANKLTPSLSAAIRQTLRDSKRNISETIKIRKFVAEHPGQMYRVRKLGTGLIVEIAPVGAWSCRIVLYDRTDIDTTVVVSGQEILEMLSE